MKTRYSDEIESATNAARRNMDRARLTERDCYDFAVAFARESAADSNADLTAVYWNAYAVEIVEICHMRALSIEFDRRASARIARDLADGFC